MTVFSLGETGNVPCIFFRSFSSQGHYPVHRITTPFLSRVQSCCSSFSLASCSSLYLSICFVPLKYSNPKLKESSMLSIISWIVGSSSFLVSLLLLIPSRLIQLRNVLLWSLYGFLPLLLIYVSKSSILESMTCFPYSSINRLYSSFFNRT